MTEGAGDDRGSPTGVKPGEATAPAGPRRATLGDLLTELRRRRIFRVVIGYGFFALAVLQASEPLIHGLHQPEWVLTAVIAALALGFPVALLLAWVYDLTRQGVTRTAPAAGSGAVTFSRGRLAALLIVVGILGALPGIAWYAWRGRGERADVSGGQTETPSIAVLAFADMSQQHDQEYFADGVAEEILNALARVEGLKVIGRTSSFSFKGKNEDLRVIARKLGVGTVLEGSVRKGGNRVRVTAQLIRAEDGSHLWSQTLERDIADLFAIQDEIARDVVQALRVKLLPGRSPSPKGTRTTSSDAYNEYLLGRDFFRRGTREDTARSLAAYEKVLVLDPSYAPAWADLSLACLNLEIWSDEANPDRRRRARLAADRAIELAPDLAEGYYARGFARWYFEWDPHGMLADMDRAFALNPNLGRVEYARGRILSALGRNEEAVAAAKRGIELDPLGAWGWWSLAAIHGAAGDRMREREALERALTISPGLIPARSDMAWNLVLSGKPAEALAFVGPMGDDEARAVVAVAQHELGRTEESRATLERLIAKDPRASAYEIAMVLAWLGERDRAFEWLDRAIALRSPSVVHANVDAALRRLRDDPRWKAFLQKANLPAD